MVKFVEVPVPVPSVPNAPAEVAEAVPYVATIDNSEKMATTQQGHIAATTPIDPNILSLNDRLQIMEECAWRVLKCETPEDALDKLTCEEIQPALSSGHQIAEDLHQIWIGSINFNDYSSLLPTPKHSSTPITNSAEQKGTEQEIRHSKNIRASSSADESDIEDHNYDEFLGVETRSSVGKLVASSSILGRSSNLKSAVVLGSFQSTESLVSPLPSPHLEQVPR